MRYLNYTIGEFEKLDIPDYLMLMDAMQYRESEKAFWTHFLAWQIMRANGKKKSGKGYKTAYPKFKLFWNEEAAMKNIKKNKKKPDSRFEGLGGFLKRKGGRADG